MNRFSILIGMTTLVIASNSSAGAGETQSSKPYINQSFTAYEKPQQFAPLNSGRKIHLYCLGRGSPTVIFTAGMGDWAATWRLVQAPIAKKVRTCAWDRAGFGFSDPSPDPQDVGHTTTDLEQALRSAKIDGPYLMVGHSLGGFESLLFADRHPSEVLGMVLVDTSFPGLTKTLKSVSPKSQAEFSNLRGMVQRCVASRMNSTQKTDSPRPGSCLGYGSYPSGLIKAMMALDTNPNRAMTQLSLLEQVDQSSQIVVNEKRKYGAMPLIILTSNGQQPKDAEASAIRLEVRRAHGAMATLSTNGSNRLVSGSGHYIQSEKPEVVISAINEVLQKIQSQSKLDAK